MKKLASWRTSGTEVSAAVSLCEAILGALTLKLDIEPQRIDLLLLVLWFHKNGAISQQQVTRAIILAHGYATASSIANVANRLLKSQLFESFDMPLDVTPEAIANRDGLHREPCSGIRIDNPVDMGSLNAIHRHFNRRLSTPMAIINNVSTGMAMYVGERILQGVMLEDIVREIGDDLAVEHQLYYPQTDKPRAILTTCATGLGAAANLSALLKASIPEALGIDIVACDVETLADPARREPMLSRYEVLAIVGTGSASCRSTTDLAGFADLWRRESSADAHFWRTGDGGTGQRDQQPDPEKLFAAPGDRVGDDPRYG